MLPNRSVCTNSNLFDIFQPVSFGQCYGVKKKIRSPKNVKRNPKALQAVSPIFHPNCMAATNSRGRPTDATISSVTRRFNTNMLKSVHNCEKRRILLKFKIVEKINLFSEQNDADCNDVKEDTYDPD